MGTALSNYGAFSLAGVATFEVAISNVVYPLADSQPVWANACGVAGVIFAFGAAAITRQAGAALAGAAIGLVLVTAAIPRPQAGEPWLAYAVELSAMLCLVVSGVLDAVRPRIVAGWIGIAGVIATITWAVKGSLLPRSAFLAVAGAVAVAFAMMLNRLLARTEQ
jgi:hypothetical protein